MSNDDLTRILISENENSIAIFRTSPKISVRPELTPQEIGDYGEKETLDLLAEIVGPQNVFYGPKYSVKEGTSEIELCDGIVRYGDTLFLIQIKTQDSRLEETQTPENYEKWISKLGKKSSEQRKKTLGWLRESEAKIPVTDMRGSARALNWKRYNLVTLLILALGDANITRQVSTRVLTRTNDKEQIDEAPLVRILLNDLLMIKKILPEKFGFLIMEYLRMTQYQTRHVLGEDYVKFFERFPIDRELKHFIRYPALLHDAFQKGKLNKDGVKKILGKMDFWLPEQKTELEDALNDPTRTSRYIVTKTGRDYPIIHIFAHFRSTPANPKSLDDALSMTPLMLESLTQPKYDKLEYDANKDVVVIFGCYSSSKEVKYFSVVQDPAGYLGEKYDVERDLASGEILY